MQKDQQALTVTQLNRQVRSWLELELGEVSVIGELSNLSKPRSGHFYFCLKDANAQIRCVFFYNHHNAESKNFTDGQQVIAKGKLSLYEARGEYQLIVQSLSEAGLGALFQQFEQIKQKLKTQGLFEPERKKPIPRFPRLIAVVTSSTGAALRDILATLKRRYPLAKVRIYASEVQGKEAAQQLIKAINRANTEEQADVLILARGGGSIEDLWAFNDEQLALTISLSKIPIVSGIGHETDFTIADFVADLRTATPTAAAEAVTPNQLDLLTTLSAYQERLLRTMNQIIQHQQLLLSHQIAKFLSPTQLINRYWQDIDYLEKQLYNSLQTALFQKQKMIHQWIDNIQSYSPLSIIHQAKSKGQLLEQQMIQLIKAKYLKLKQNLSTTMATLHAVSPLATLDRGYALATYQKSILFNSAQVKIGETIEVLLAKGTLLCRVLEQNRIGLS